MYIFTLVGDVQKVIGNLRKQYGDFTLVMLYNSGGLQASSSWNLIVSAPWTDELGVAPATSVIADALNKGLELQDKGPLSRVTVLRTNDPFVLEMTALYPVTPGSQVPIPQVTAGQITEGSGFLLYSQQAF
jgi:hypothetical protein